MLYIVILKAILGNCSYQSSASWHKHGCHFNHDCYSGTVDSVRSTIQITNNFNEGTALEGDLQLARLTYMVESVEGDILLNFPFLPRFHQDVQLRFISTLLKEWHIKIIYSSVGLTGSKGWGSFLNFVWFLQLRHCDFISMVHCAVHRQFIFVN